MRGLQNRLLGVVTLSILGMSIRTEVHAQTSSYLASVRSSSNSASNSTSTSNSSSASASSYSPQIMPFPFTMYSGGTSGLSPTDAAALGANGNQTGNMFNNPMAAPFIYSSMFPMQNGTGTTTGSGSSTNGFGLSGMATNQLGLMMMANQQMGGIGSGQLSGVRPNARAQARSKTGKGEEYLIHRNLAEPAGLAARYFNRTTIYNRRPQISYNRPSSYYPQAAH